MKSAVPKVLHRVAGLPMIDYVLASASALQPQPRRSSLGIKAELAQGGPATRRGLTFVVQEPQLGTAHALMTAPALDGSAGTLVLLSGDVPLLTTKTLETRWWITTTSTRASATVVTAIVDNPHGYGRIVRSGERIARIVEERDASPAERDIREINSGIYAFALDGLFDAVRQASRRKCATGNTTCPIWSRFTASAAWASKP